MIPECTLYNKCRRYIRAISSKTKKPLLVGCCGQIQCVRNPVFDVRYDLFQSEEAYQEEQKELKKQRKEMIERTEVVRLPPEMTDEDFSSKIPLPKKYGSPKSILEIAGMVRETEDQAHVENIVEVEAPLAEKLAETEKKLMAEVLSKTSDIKKLQKLLKDSELKGYSDMTIKIQKKLNQLSGLQKARDAVRAKKLKAKE